MIVRIVAASIGACLGALLLPAAASAGSSLGSVDGLPFFGHPYPYGYVYRRPPIQCYDVRTVDTPVGPRVQVTWICDAPVTARY